MAKQEARSSSHDAKPSSRKTILQHVILSRIARFASQAGRNHPGDRDLNNHADAAKSDSSALPSCSQNGVDRSQRETPLWDATSDDGEDLWLLADKQLRKNPNKRKLLEQADRMLQQRLSLETGAAGRSVVDRVNDFLSTQWHSLDNDVDVSSTNGRYNISNDLLRSGMRRLVDASGKISVTARPGIPAARVCAGVGVLFQMCAQVLEQRERRLKACFETANSVYLLTTYEQLLRSDTGILLKAARSPMVEACARIVEFQALALRYEERSRTGAAIRDAFGIDEWEKMLSDISDATATVEKIASAHSQRGVIEVRKLLGDAEDQRRWDQTQGLRKRRIEFLQGLQANGCSYQDIKDRNRKKVPGTCQWFKGHEMFRCWNTSAGTRMSNFLLVTADPGCGKSVLSRDLIDNVLPQNGRIVCYFFFKDDFDDQKSIRHALCTILHQLFTSAPKYLTELIIDEYESTGSRFFSSLSTLWKVFLRAAGHQETVCVIDALDECQDGDRKEFIDTISILYSTHLATPSSGLTPRFLVTSRPYDHILRRFSTILLSGFRAIHLQGAEGTTSDDIADEIKHVMHSRINQIACAFSLEPEERDLMTQQLDCIVNRTYIWITLLFDGLMDKKSGMTKQDILELTNELPTSADEAYEKILSRSPDPHESKRILCIVLAAERPLTLLEIGTAIAFKSDRDTCSDVAKRLSPSNARIKDRVRNACGLFITIVDEKAYLIHQTAREFLLRPTPLVTLTSAEPLFTQPECNTDHGSLQAPERTCSLVWKHCVTTADAHLILTNACLSYLLLCFDKVDPTFLDYCMTHWAHHYRHSDATACEARWSGEDFCTAVKSRKARLTVWQNGQPEVIVLNLPLIVASILGSEQYVTHILSNVEADVEAEDTAYGQTALLWAVDFGHIKVLRLLLEEGNANVEAKARDNRETALIGAARKGHIEMVKALLGAKADVEAKDREGWTALMWAAQEGHAVVVRALLEANANVDVEDKTGRTALMLTLHACSAEVAKMLLDAER